MAEDMLRFVLAFSTPITTNAPHIYVSALPFVPLTAKLWKNTSKLFPKLLDVCEGRMERWPTRPDVWYGHSRAVRGVVFSPNGRHIVSCAEDGTIRLWDAETAVAMCEPLRRHNGPVYSVAYSPDGRRIVSGSFDDTVRIWDAQTGAAGESLRGHSGPVFCTAYSPDGRKVVSSSDDDTIRIWDTVTATPEGKQLDGRTNGATGVA